MNIRAFLKLALLFLTSSFLILSAAPAWSQGRIEVTDVTSTTETVEAPPPTYNYTKSRERQPRIGRRYSQTDAAPESGREAASKYMGSGEKKSSASESRRPAGTSSERYLALHFGPFLSSDSFHWGRTDKVRDAGNWTAGLTYRLGGWENSADFAIRFDVSTFDLPEGKATKIALLPMILFPDASSQFPLYFGGGVGLGVMSKQIDDESALALEYQLVGGVRFFELAGSAGAFIEAGIKNHIHILSDGQFNGAFISFGTVFTF